MAFADSYRDKSVLVTGHTGFKGSWLCEWLLNLGAHVTGLALAPMPDAPLFDQLGLAPRLQQEIGDVRDLATVQKAVALARPDFIFHLAAQPLVRLSYEQPVETYATNFLGTVHVLEAARQAAAPCTFVSVTTDKCYENKEWLHGYREEDPLGGHDPYSSSKGAAEIAINAYRRSYFSTGSPPIRLASARAGNVIGGGDWAADRIVPDSIRALEAGRPIPVRNKGATRPWQHVLEPLSGYLQLGACMANPSLARRPQLITEAFNFGPELDSNRSVEALVEEILKSWPGEWTDQSDPHAVHEATLLNLAIDKARHVLGWFPVWDFPTTINRTVSWYRAAQDSPAFDAAHSTREQIAAYTRIAADRRVSWAIH